MAEQTQQKRISRWKKGGQRYGKEDQKGLTKLQAQRRDGWRNGARVTRK
jgi:ribosomal protein L32